MISLRSQKRYGLNNYPWMVVVVSLLAILLMSIIVPQFLIENAAAAAAITPTPTASLQIKSTATSPVVARQTEGISTELSNNQFTLQEIAQKLFEQKLLSTDKGSLTSLSSVEQQIAKRGYFAWQTSGYMPRNFIVRANATWDSASPNADWNMSGLGFVFRENDGTNYYAAFLLLNGYVDIFRVENNGSSLKRLIHKRYGKLDLPQGKASLMLVVEEPQILFFVNNKLTAKVSDELLRSEKFHSGRLNFALASGTNRDYGLRVRMEQIECWTIGDEKLPTPTPTSPFYKPIPTPDALTTQGIQAFQQGNYAQAVVLLNQAIEGNLAYSSAEGYLYRARAQSELGNFTAALNDFQLAIQNAPSDALPYLYRGYTYQKMGEMKKALDDFSKTIELNPNEVWAYRARAALYAEQGNVQKALEDYDEVLQRVTDHAIDYNNRCWLYTQLKEYQKALADCNQALSLSPKTIEFLDTRASLYIAIGEKDKAKADLEAILRLNPGKTTRSRVQEALKQLK